jgi:hypothetical protein
VRQTSSPSPSPEGRALLTISYCASLRSQGTQLTAQRTNGVASQAIRVTPVLGDYPPVTLDWKAPGYPQVEVVIVAGWKGLIETAHRL